jgi:cysteine desulfurase
MSVSPIYLDYAATSPLRPEAAQAWLEVAQIGLNASSVHGLGRKGKAIIETARETILRAVGATTETLIFTSGGTEANALALHQVHNGFERIIVGATEHDSIMVTAMRAGIEVEIAPVLSDGTVDRTALETLLAKEGRSLVCVMQVNNETGVIHDIASISSMVRARDGWLHVDAVQALGKCNIDFNALGADSMALSAHKIGGPQGVGALVTKSVHHIWPMITGGGQERGARAGTENVAGIAAFGAAIGAMALGGLQNPIEDRLKAFGCTILGNTAPRVGQILCFAQPHWSSQLQLMYMDMNGICVSSGSACSSGKVKESRVVKAMGFDDLAGNVVRVSGGWTTTDADWHTFFEIWSQGYAHYMHRHTIQKVSVG